MGDGEMFRTHSIQRRNGKMEMPDKLVGVLWDSLEWCVLELIEGMKMVSMSLQLKTWVNKELP